MRVVHVIGGLHQGGTELVLAQLVRSMPERFDNRVVSLLPGGAVAAAIRDSGVSVESVGLSRRSPVTGMVRLARLLPRLCPDLIQTWIYHADLIGGITGRLRTRAPVVWNVRQSKVTNADPRSVAVLARACAVASRVVPAAIVVNSEAGRQYHQSLGYDASRFRVIRNGFDVARYRPDPAVRRSARAAFGLQETFAVGLVGRLNPNKGHRSFMEACRAVRDRGFDVTAVLVGSGTDDASPLAKELVAQAGMADHVMLLGSRADVPAILNALDVAVSASVQEGFPNAVGEAMAAGVPVVATNVGDTAALVGPAGSLVPPGDVVALANALESLLSVDSATRAAIGDRARERIVREFAIDSMVGAYVSLYDDIAGRP